MPKKRQMNNGPKKAQQTQSHLSEKKERNGMKGILNAILFRLLILIGTHFGDN